MAISCPPPLPQTPRAFPPAVTQLLERAPGEGFQVSSRHGFQLSELFVAVMASATAAAAARLRARLCSARLGRAPPPSALRRAELVKLALVSLRRL